MSRGLGECLELRLHPPALSVVSVILYPEHSLVGVGLTMGSQPRNFFQSVWIPFVGSPVAFTRGCLILCPISTPPTAILLQKHVSSLEWAHCFSSLLLAISARLRVGAALGKVTCKSTESRGKTVNSWHPQGFQENCCWTAPKSPVWLERACQHLLHVKYVLCTWSFPWTVWVP